MMANYEILQGDWVEVLKSLPDESVHCCITSPPYWGLRDYGVEGQLGLEKTPAEYVDRIVAGFEQVRRVLRSDGTLWLNLGDSYHTGDGYKKEPTGSRHRGHIQETNTMSDIKAAPHRQKQPGLKTKDMVGIPWRVAFALQAAGWYLRSDIIWHKPNPMPESVRDRPTKGHEYLFLLSKSEKYYYDIKAYAEPCIESNASRPRMGQGGNTVYKQKRSMMKVPAGWATGAGSHKAIFHARVEAWRKGCQTVPFSSVDKPETRNRRTVWTVPIQPFKGAHFATFPLRLIEPCVLAGCPEGGVVLDPFNGSGTTGIAAVKHQRKYLGVELNSEYIAMAKKRISDYQNKHGMGLLS
jgi:DNA modification methylase